MAWVNIANEESGLSVRNKINALGAATAGAVHFGIYDYGDTSTAGSPVSVPGDGSWVDIPNNGGSTFKQIVPGITDMWSTGTQRFDFSGLSLFDAVDIRLDLVVTAGSLNTTSKVRLLFAEGAGNFTLDWREYFFRDTNPHGLLSYSSLYMRNTLTKDNPAKFQISADGACDLVVRGWFIRPMLRVPVAL